MVQKKFELLSHTADTKVRVFASCYEEIFQHALCAMFSFACPRLKHVNNAYDVLSCSILPCTTNVHIQAPERLSLLVDFLSYALCQGDIRNEAYFDARIKFVSETEICAVLCGDVIIGCDGVEIKAVTYHDLVIEQNEHGWYADIVFDI